MNNIERFTTIRLELSRVAWYLGNLLSALLGRQITCTAQSEDDCYWGVRAVNDRFSNSEVVGLIHYVGGGADMIRCSIPPDSNSSKSLSMELCEELLKHMLKLDWKREFITEDALWLLGDWPDPVCLPEADEDLIFIDSRVIDCGKLMAKDDFVEALFEDGGTFTALTNLCERNQKSFGTPLYWIHPYTDGLHNGCYFVLVKEGVLVLSYDAIDWEEHEVFERESARLCGFEEMQNFAWEYRKHTTEMLDTISAFLFFLERKEDLANG